MKKSIFIVISFVKHYSLIANNEISKENPAESNQAELNSRNPWKIIILSG